LSADLALTAVKPRCASCIHFRNDARALEAAIPGLTALSSADNASRGEDGLCLQHGRYLSARAWCDEFRARGVTAPR